MSEGRAERRQRDVRSMAVGALDIASWGLGAVVTALAFGSDVRLWESAVLATAVHLAIAMQRGLYRGRYRPLSDDEAEAAIVTGGTAVAATIAVVAAVSSPTGSALFEPSILLLGYASIATMTVHRVARRVRARQHARRRSTHLVPVVVIGAGEGGHRAITLDLLAPTSRHRAVALVDDDPARRRTYIGGLTVCGTTDDLARVAREHKAHAALVAIPSASASMLRHLDGVIRAAGLEPLVMPPVRQLVSDDLPAAIRPLSDEELLGRELIEIDDAGVRSVLAGSDVLVTGAGGSIGSELARQIATHGPATLVLLDNDDSHLHQLHRVVTAPPETRVVHELADIRDRERMYQIFGAHRPSIVFHAAALKHVPALEAHPLEGWKTNVLGTANVLEAATSVAVDRFVNISTDKAADPLNVLGLTKRIAERVTSTFADETGEPYVSVRFGNVMASRGSVIETFHQQIAAGGPVTVTDPEVTRYFMAVREAVRLTLQASTIGRPGEVLVLDMGEPVRVIDLARQMIERSGRPIEISITGLRPGEKMHEVLVSPGEHPTRPFHSMIDHVYVPPIDLAEALADVGSLADAPCTITALAAIARHTTLRDDTGTLTPTEDLVS